MRKASKAKKAPKGKAGRAATAQDPGLDAFVRHFAFQLSLQLPEAMVFTSTLSDADLDSFFRRLNACEVPAERVDALSEMSR